MKNFILGILFVVLVAGVGFFAYQYGVNQSKKSIPKTETEKISPTTGLVGNDKDEHGCIGSAGYSWCAVKNKCLRTWEEACVTPTVANEDELIKKALLDKHGWKTEDVVITISKNDGQYASGGVTEKNAQAGGGYFFAAKTASGWKIVADGNGTISCSSLIPYPNYPVSMIPECYDEATSQSVKR